MNRWLVDVLAVHRLTRLVTDDDITQPARDRIIAAAYEPVYWQAQKIITESSIDIYAEGGWQQIVDIDLHPPKIATLITCRWCASIWITLGLVLLVRRRRWWPPIADALALSSAATLLARLED